MASAADEERERGAAARIERIHVAAYRFPTDRPESDGTFEWDATTAVVVRVVAGGVVGIGSTYASAVAAALVDEVLVHVVKGHLALAPRAAWADMVRAVRNVGRPGEASTAIAAVDIALWDLHARLLNTPLATLLGAGGPPSRRMAAAASRRTPSTCSSSSLRAGLAPGCAW